MGVWEGRHRVCGRQRKACTCREIASGGGGEGEGAATGSAGGRWGGGPGGAARGGGGWGGGGGQRLTIPNGIGPLLVRRRRGCQLGDFFGDKCAHTSKPSQKSKTTHPGVP